ncbi:pectinesterase, partial [Paenibacillus sepulcri]|nr:pectinesterase [Paenibacillus sepulcri]
MKRWLAIVLCIVLGLSLFQPPIPTAKASYDAISAFPGAEGFGYSAAGGRGGEVYHVTSYELTGPGTFHDALMTAGTTPRTIVFDISGEITIPQIVVSDKSRITIAGQTAPRDGVTIRGNNIRFINCSDIVIRYLRFRMGVQNFNDDTMYFEDCQNVIIDHSSFSWGTDEVLSIKSKDYDNPKSKNITVQWSIISEGLLTHSMGGLIEMNTITMHHNLYAHNNDRNPKTKGQIDFVNNIIYNWGGYPYVAGGESGTKGYGNVTGNYFIAGVNSASPQYAVVRGNENYSLYLENNRIDSNKNGILDGTDTGTGMMEAEKPSVVVPERFEYPPVHMQDPEVAYDYILDHSGASLVRDKVDQRVINSVRKQTGVIIGHENDVGGFPHLAQGRAPRDTDLDGMPDAWEKAKGLNPNNPEDRNGDRNKDGYTNLEDYLNKLAAPGFPVNYPEAPPAWSGTPFIPPVEPTTEPESGPVPSLDGNAVRSVVVRDNSSNGSGNAANWSVEENLQTGDFVAGDRLTGSSVYKFVTIPDELKGMEWIRSAVGSRSATSDDLLSFYLAADADVYVAHDSRITTRPLWLTSSYEDTALIIADDQPVQFKLYKKHYTAGSYVTMGANNSTSSMNYFVILKPANP